jgi:drug/metabolite transporter (DMT)-like permease
MNRRAWILMVALAALWGASYMFIHISLEDGLSAPFIVWVRIVLGALALSLLARGALRELRSVRREIVLLGLVQVAGPFLLITYGQRWIPSSLAAILVAAAPIWVALIAPLMSREEIVRGWAAIGVVVGIVGVALLFGIDLSGEDKLFLGGAMVLLASLGYAIGAIWVRRDLSGVSPVALAAGTMIVASIATLPPALVDPSAGDANLGTAAALFVLGVGGTGIAFYIFFWLIADVGASRASLVAYLAPGFAVTYGAIFLDEAITGSTLAGLALILAGGYLAAERRLPWRPSTPIVMPDPAGEDLLTRSGPSRSSAPEPELARRSPAA